MKQLALVGAIAALSACVPAAQPAAMPAPVLAAEAPLAEPAAVQAVMPPSSTYRLPSAVPTQTWRSSHRMAATSLLRSPCSVE